MSVRVGRWWQELTHPCKYLKNNNWRTSRLFLTYLLDNNNNSQGLATQWQSQSQQWSTIDSSSWSAIHTRQLRWPGDYLKNNRTKLLPPCVHTFTVKNNQRKETFSIKIRQLNISQRERQLMVNHEREHSWTEAVNRHIAKKARHC